jgi:hypothetical protein
MVDAPLPIPILAPADTDSEPLDPLRLATAAPAIGVGKYAAMLPLVSAVHDTS